MKVKIIDCCGTPPLIGQYFRHRNSGAVWRRLEKQRGWVTIMTSDDCFPSYNVETGEIKFTVLDDCKDIIILKPDSVVKFAPKKG